MVVKENSGKKYSKYCVTQHKLGEMYLGISKKGLQKITSKVYKKTRKKPKLPKQKLLISISFFY